MLFEKIKPVGNFVDYKKQVFFATNVFTKLATDLRPLEKRIAKEFYSRSKLYRRSRNEVGPLSTAEHPMEFEWEPSNSMRTFCPTELLTPMKYWK